MRESMLRAIIPSRAAPDGRADRVQAVALAAGSIIAADVPARPAGGHPARRPIAHPATIITAALAQKVLHGWLQNRYQTRYPLVLKLENQTPAEAALIVAAVRYALQAVAASPAEMAQAAAWLATVGGHLPDTGGADVAPPFPALLHAHLGPHAYGACAGALGRRALANRRFLDFLAARLGIPDEVARSLNRRFAG